MADATVNLVIKVVDSQQPPAPFPWLVVAILGGAVAAGLVIYKAV